MVALPVVNKICESVKVKIKKHDTHEIELRKPMMRSMCCSMKYSCEPHVDTNHTPTTAIGAVYRNGRKIPTCKYREELREFAKDFFSSNFSKPTVVMSFEEWLETTNYNEARKNQLRKCKLELGEFNHLNFVDMMNLVREKIDLVDCFVKDEQYIGFKHSRGIYSRSDYFKVLFGPYVKTIEQVVYKTEFFIKNVPVSERARFITEALGECEHLIFGDFSSFESHSTEFMYEDVIKPFYRYISSDLPLVDQEVLSSMVDVLARTNFLDFRTFTMEVKSKKCSGEMDTSLSNGILNIILLSFIAKKLNLSNFKIIVEGDDSIGGYCGPKMPRVNLEDYGCIIDLCEINDLSEASFCSMVFDPQTLTQMTDFMHAFNRMNVKRKYLNACPSSVKALARAKAACMLFQYNGCPILTSYCSYILRNTNNVKIRRSFIEDTTYHPELRAILESEIKITPLPVKQQARVVYEKAFGVSIADQLEMEKIFDSTNEYKEFDDLVFLRNTKGDWLSYHHYYNTQSKSCIGSRGFEYRGDIDHIVKGNLYSRD